MAEAETTTKARTADILPFTLSILRQSIASLPDFPPVPEPGTDPDTAIVMYEARYKAIVAYANGSDRADDSDEFGNYLGNIECACYWPIAELPASKPDALAAKVRLLKTGIADGFGSWDGPCVESLLVDLDRMAGAP